MLYGRAYSTLQSVGNRMNDDRFYFFVIHKEAHFLLENPEQQSDF